MRLKHRLKSLFWILFIVFLFIAFFSLYFRNWESFPEKGYIAHACGSIDGHRYTNSLEALSNAIDKGIKYIEVDFDFTSDSVLVALHSWGQFNSMISREGNKPIPYNDFKNSLILGKYHPLDARMIDSIFTENPNLTLVTDRVDDIEVLKRNLPNLEGRMIVECFSEDAYQKVKASKFAIPLKSGYMSPKDPFHCFRPFILSDTYYRDFKDKIHYKLLTKVLNYPVAVYITTDEYGNRDISAANSIMAADPSVKLVYIDEF